MAHSDYYAQIDRYAYINKLSKCSPVTKAFFALSTLVITVSAQSIVVPIIVFVIMTSLVVQLAGVKARFYVNLLRYPTFMVALSCLIIALFSFSGGEALAQLTLNGFTYTIFKSGVSLALTIFFRVEGALSCLFFLVLTTSITDLSLLLRRIHVPKALIEISMLIYRYIFVFLEVSEQMTIAQTMRLGKGGWMKKIRGLALLAGNLFIRALEQAERTFTAMSSRGYDGTIRVLEEFPRPNKAILVAIVLFDVLLAFAVFFTLNFGVL
ncbi:MAG: cobalt ECF transporter T component CbiQ [Candidatus Bathyarchaeia archaeon]|jgi:cobalt/nickel transport system permease protein